MKAIIPHTFLIQLRKYNLENVLSHISSYSYYITHNEESDNKALVSESIIINDRRVPFSATTWYMVDLTYFAIMNCRRKGGKVIETRDEFIELVWNFIIFSQEREGNNPIFKHRKQADNKPSKDIYFYIGAMAGEQFLFQNVSRYFENIRRNHFILDRISGSIDDGIDTRKILFDELRITPNDLLSVLFALFCALEDYRTTRFDIIANYIKIDIPIFNSILNYYSIDITSIRESDLKRQQLLVTPLIRLEGGRYICPCAPLLCYTMSTAWLWIVRNHYYNTGNQAFIKAFGEYYESYFEKEIAEKYLTGCVCERIKEAKCKKADWHIKTEKISFIIEQKSAIASIYSKQQNSDIESIKKYVKRNWEEALIQLSSTQIDYPSESLIKIVLVFEDYFKLNITFEETVASISNKIIDDGYYWLATTRDIEILFYLYKNDRGSYDTIIDEMIKSSSRKERERKSLSMIIADNNIHINHHLNAPEFKVYLDEVLNRLGIVGGF